MKRNTTATLLVRLSCLVLIAALALTLSACGQKQPETTAPIDGVAEQASPAVLGTGATVFTLKVTTDTGSSTDFIIHTDEKTVGAALLNVGLIAGTPSEYGLYVTTVNGITADYNTDGTYWAFYVNGDYATTGVDTTDVTPDGCYELKKQK